MAILSALQSAALRLMGQRPAVFFTSGHKLELELADLVNVVARDIVRYQDWQALVRVSTVTGNGSATSYPLPNDYDRMLIKSNLQDSVNWAWGYSHFTDINDFLYQKNRGWGLSPGGWIIYGGKMEFQPAPSGTFQFPYISKNYARDSSGALKPEFTSDTDEFLLPEDLLTLGLIWRWRENKKLDAAGDQEAFIKALDEVAAKDKGSRIYRTGPRGLRGSFSTAYHGIAPGF